ncbi:MAG: FUSC family protein [Burkholderiales bacterium]|nr:FUSC family protein [Burkholderiales bacterium]
MPVQNPVAATQGSSSASALSQPATVSTLPVHAPTSGNADQDKHLGGIFGSKENFAFFTACVRFFFAISISLFLSVLLNDEKIGGFACLASFMVLLSDTKSKLSLRLLSSLITLFIVAAAVLVGYLCQFISYGKWIVLTLTCFGASLLPFVETFWWVVSKYFLIFLMVSLFDFRPDLAALEGYFLGYIIAVIVIIIDSFVWRIEKEGPRPIDQLKEVIGGMRNPWDFAILSALILFLSLWTGALAGLQQLAWVGISVIYLLGTKVTVGLKKSYQRLVGTALGYASVVAIFSTPVSYNLDVLGPFIVLFGTPIPYFIVNDYLMAQVCITGYILLDLEWLLKSYGGDGNLLGWRLFDTCWGTAWSIIGLILLAIVRKIEMKYHQRKTRKAVMSH